MRGEAPERVVNAWRIDANARRSPRACCQHWDGWMPIRGATPEHVANAGTDGCQFEAYSFRASNMLNLVSRGIGITGLRLTPGLS
jgi:hypothetical protein